MMKLNPRLIILVLVILAVGAIFVVPYLDLGKGPLNSGKIPDTFSTTERPAEKLEQAMEQGRPVFLEFYAKW